MIRFELRRPCDLVPILPVSLRVQEHEKVPLAPTHRPDRSVVGGATVLDRCGAHDL